MDRNNISKQRENGKNSVCKLVGQLLNVYDKMKVNNLNEELYSVKNSIEAFNESHEYVLECISNIEKEIIEFEQNLKMLNTQMNFIKEYYKDIRKVNSKRIEITKVQIKIYNKNKELREHKELIRSINSKQNRLEARRKYLNNKINSRL